MLHLGLIAAACLALPSGQDLLNLEVRIFDGRKDVTAEARVTIHRAGDRDKPVAQASGVPGTPLMRVPAGIYDAQAIHQRDGRVVAIRWAERLVVMPYPDEAGHHLQVINFETGYGALQLRPASPVGPDDQFLLLGSSGPGQYQPAPTGRHGYVLFVVPAGQYDLQVTRAGTVAWYHDIEVPLDRTRFWVVP
jgi:hypothetical protein